MNANRVGTGFRRRGRAEGERLVSEFEQSGLGRKEFSVAHGLSVHTLDALRVVLGAVLCIEVDPGFDASELRRLIVVLDSVPPRNGLQPLV